MWRGQKGRVLNGMWGIKKLTLSPSLSWAKNKAYIGKHINLLFHVYHLILIWPNKCIITNTYILHTCTPIKSVIGPNKKISVFLVTGLVLFDLILYVHSTIFQLCGTGITGLENLRKGRNTYFFIWKFFYNFYAFWPFKMHKIIFFQTTWKNSRFHQ